MTNLEKCNYSIIYKYNSVTQDYSKYIVVKTPTRTYSIKSPTPIKKEGQSWLTYSVHDGEILGVTLARFLWGEISDWLVSPAYNNRDGMLSSENQY